MHINTEQLSSKMNVESGRTCAILGAAALDVSLEVLWRSRLACYADELLKGMAPLATFSARIKLARALNLICENTNYDLHQIRQIRNDCAHSCDLELDFDTASIRDKCLSLRTAAAFIEGLESTKTVHSNPLAPSAIDAVIGKFSSPRWRFQLAVDFLVQHLRDLALNDVSGGSLLNEVRTLGEMMIPQIKGELKVS